MATAITQPALQNISDGNRLQKLLALEPNDLKSQSDWTHFFNQLNLLKKQTETSSDTKLKKGYYQIVRKMYPNYQLSQATREFCYKRTQLVWNQLKKSPEFEAGMYKYIYGNQTEKNQGIQKIATALEKACQSFYKPSNFKVVIYDSKTLPEYASSGGFYNPETRLAYNPQTDTYNTQRTDKIYINTSQNKTAGYVLNTLYHEMTHALQTALISDSKNQYAPKYVDSRFIPLLKAFEPVYVSNMSLKNDFEDVRKKDPSFATDYQRDYTAYLNNPQEQEAFLAGNILNVLANNWMREHGIDTKQMVFDYRLKDRFHFPFQSDEQVCKTFGEKKALPTYKKRHILSHDFWDKTPLKHDAAKTDINPYHQLGSAQKYYNIYLQNPSNESAFLKSIQYGLTALNYSRDINDGPSKQVLTHLRMLLTDKNMAKYPKLKTRLSNVFNLSIVHTDKNFSATLQEQKNLLNNQTNVFSSERLTQMRNKSSLIKNLKICQTTLPTPSLSSSVNKAIALKSSHLIKNGNAITDEAHFNPLSANARNGLA